MKRIRRTSILIFISIAAFSVLVSCTGGPRQMKGEESINDLIYPYLIFEKNDDGTVSASVAQGAKLKDMRIPAEVSVGGEKASVSSFKGFRDPDDASGLKTVMLPKGTKVEEGALDRAENLEWCKVEGAETTDTWGKLPVLSRDGYEFLGWFAGDSKIYEGMPVDPAFPDAVPKWRAHTYVEHEGKEPTCTEDGWKPYVTCKTCDYTTFERIPALGHDLVHHEKKEATCTEEGSIEHWCCRRCGKCFTDGKAENEVTDTVIPKKPHILIHKPGKAPTCVSEGNIEFWWCSTCGRYFSDGDAVDEINGNTIILPKTEHDIGKEWLNDDVMHWHECSSCKGRFGSEKHTWDEGTVTKEPTPFENGIRTYVCTVCGRTREDEIPAEEHDFGIPVVVEPTCTERGYTKWFCTKCEKTFIDPDSYTDPLGHAPELQAEVPATCSEEGVREHWKCGRCGELFLDADATIPVNDPSVLVIEKLPHTWEVKSDGENHWKECSVCHEKTEIEPHAWEEIPSTEFLIRSATCTEPALYRVSCRCGIAGEETFEYGEPLGHRLEHRERIDATCTEDGMAEHWWCPVCGKYFTDPEGRNEVPESSLVIKGEHVWSGNWEITKDGHRKICSVCGKAYGETEPHDMGNRTDPVHHWKECSVCHHREDVEEHRWEILGDRVWCPVCGYVKETPIEQGGFDVSTEDRIPRGRLSASEKDSVWTFSFVDENPEHPPLTYEWYLDGERQEESSSGFTLEATRPQSYTVMVIFMNDDGVGSDSITVTGRPR